jgi:hypothetical protein
MEAGDENVLHLNRVSVSWGAYYSISPVRDPAAGTVGLDGFK